MTQTHPRPRAGRTILRTAQSASPFRGRLVSVAGLIGQDVTNAAGEDVGKVVDLVVHLTEQGYPPLAGILVRIGRQRVHVKAGDIASLVPTGVRLGVDLLDLRAFERGDGEVLLAHDVIDHQLVDVDGIQVIRASDLYLAETEKGVHRLVGADVGLASLVRRLGPRALRTRITPDRVIDWAAIRPFSHPGDAISLTQSNDQLRMLRPAELGDLLDQLTAPHRQELLNALDPASAADAVEEMEDDEVTALFESAPVEQAADLLEMMEPDEATDALRGVGESRRDELLDHLSTDLADELRDLVARDPNTAGGLMSTRQVVLRQDQRVADALNAGRRYLDEVGPGLGLVVVVDAAGVLLDTVSLLEIALGSPDAPLSELTGPPWPVTVHEDAGLDEVIRALRDERGTEVVVVDADRHPVGIIGADDVVDALVSRGRRGAVWKDPR